MGTHSPLLRIVDSIKHTFYVVFCFCRINGRLAMGGQKFKNESWPTCWSLIVVLSIAKHWMIMWDSIVPAWPQVLNALILLCVQQRNSVKICNGPNIGRHVIPQWLVMDRISVKLQLTSFKSYLILNSVISVTALRAQVRLQSTLHT